MTLLTFSISLLKESSIYLTTRQVLPASAGPISTTFKSLQTIKEYRDISLFTATKVYVEIQVVCSSRNTSIDRRIQLFILI